MDGRTPYFLNFLIAFMVRILYFNASKCLAVDAYILGFENSQIWQKNQAAQRPANYVSNT